MIDDHYDGEPKEDSQALKGSKNFQEFLFQYNQEEGKPFIKIAEQSVHEISPSPSLLSQNIGEGGEDEI